MNELVVFAKHWQPGLVKTRLAAEIGNEKASLIYRGFIEALLDRFERMGDRRCIVYSPPTASAAFAQLVGRREWLLRPQSSGDLGVRMFHEVQNSLGEGTKALVLLGSDSPSLPLAYVKRAFSALKANDVVLGPSHDGGYYLVGLRRAVPEIFRDIPWGSPGVWQQTMARLGQLSRPATHAVLPSWFDVDRVDDLRRLECQLQNLAITDPSLAKLRRHIRRTLAG